MTEEAIFLAPAALLANPASLLANTAETMISDPAMNSNSFASSSVEKEEEGIQEHCPGYIFMCNHSTKLQCYQYRVFGLPMGAKEMVEAIKPGSKLFLFDFELKLLYGIYEATSAGKLNIEPAAFGGKFPAQVKFRIFKECLPMPESSLRHVIKENYMGLKFKQELSGEQVGRFLKAMAEVVPAPHANPAEASISDPAMNSNSFASNSVEKEEGRQKHCPGFIFMCNHSSKLQCYQYRVFGLPKGAKEKVEAIKPGSKLFLFDFESKLLYGIYEATSAGELYIEPAAFGGKFPAQVKFRIFKECLPLPESSLKHVIKENYMGSKFKQELTEEQVGKLSSSFRPLIASPSQSAHQAPLDVSLFQAMLPALLENQYKLTARAQATGYTGGMGSYYVPNSQQTGYTGGVSHGVNEPYPRTIEGWNATNSGMQYYPSHPIQGEHEHNDNAVSYNYYQQAPAPYTSSIMQQHPEPGIGQNSASSSYYPYASSNMHAYNSSFMQPQPPPPPAVQPHLHQYGYSQENAITSSYEPHASTNFPQHTSSFGQPRLPSAGDYQENATPSCYFPY